MTEMKDSGFDFIGQIPENWTILRIKHAAWLKGRIGWDGLKAEEFTDKGPYLITGTDFDNGAVNWETCVHISDERFEEDQLLHIKESDLLITKDGTVGKVAIVKGCPEKVSLNSGIMIIRNYTKYKYLDKYMYYTLMSNVFTDWFNYNTKPGTTILHLYQHDFDNFKFLLPPLEEQQQIVTYLDARCSKIDSAIAQRKAIIEKLKDYKSAVIIKTVTKGLNPDAVMKDSGLKWVDTIPIHWNAKRLKFLVNTSSGSTPNSKTREYYENGNLNWIQSGDLYNKTFIEAVAKKITELAIKECRLKFYIAPFLVVAMYGASIGNISISLIDSYTNQACCVLLPKVDVNIKFLYYAISVAKTDLLAEAIGGSQPNISQDKINNLKIPLPPVNEQQEIAYYLDSQCAKIDEAIAKQEQAVTKLEEYRKSIIYYAVTGKIDCRDI